MKYSRLLAVLIVATLSHEAGASISVTWTGGNASYSVTSLGGNLFDVTLTKLTPASADTNFVVSGDVNDTVRILTVDNPSPLFAFVSVRGATPTGRIGAVQSITTPNPPTAGGVIIQSLRTNGNVGSVSAHIITGVDVSGSITGSLTCLASNSVSYPRVDTVVVAGSVFGNISANTGFNGTKGQIRSLSVGGSIGTVSSPVSISVTGIIGSITAGSIYANFDIAPTDPNAGYFRNITTTNGPFVGSLHSRAIWADAGSGTPGIYIAGGDLDADVRVEGAVYSTTQFQVLGTGKVLKPGRTLSFGLQYPASMDFADNGIQGQVVFNAAALTSPPYNQWSTTVKENGITLTPTPSYTMSSASLGGGAVGLVPFRIHATDSEPDHASSWTADTFPATVKIHHYGPIELSGSNPPVTIERQEYGVYPEPA